MNVIFISPHPDDETLGCGGAILNHKEKGDNISWLNITNITKMDDWSKEFTDKRQKEMKEVAKEYKFDNVYDLELPTTMLDTIPISEIVGSVSKIFKSFKPEIIYSPYPHDVHTDHKIASRALMSTYKWFRHAYIKKIFLYETISETDFNFLDSFNPNTYLDISKFINDKIKIMSYYESETGDHPFPRSEKSIRALATVRGSQCGYNYAEAFQLIYQRS